MTTASARDLFADVAYRVAATTYPQRQARALRRQQLAAQVQRRALVVGSGAAGVAVLACGADQLVGGLLTLLCTMIGLFAVLVAGSALAGASAAAAARRRMPRPPLAPHLRRDLGLVATRAAQLDQLVAGIPDGPAAEIGRRAVAAVRASAPALAALHTRRATLAALAGSLTDPAAQQQLAGTRATVEAAWTDAVRRLDEVSVGVAGLCTLSHSPGLAETGPLARATEELWALQTGWADLAG
jgi:hypothetical protein